MAYVPPTGNDTGTPESRSTVAIKLALLVGILLLLPGLCSILFAGAMFLSDPGDFIKQLGRGDPILQSIMVLWGVCLLVSVSGFILVRHARKRMRQP
jgi:predicted membrane protein